MTPGSFGEVDCCIAVVVVKVPEFGIVVEPFATVASAAVKEKKKQSYHIDN